MTILALSGSLREGSYNTALARAAAALAPEGVEVELYERLGDLPLYDADLDTGLAPEAVRALRDRIEGADALLVTTPEYNGSISGVLKNAIDWASRPYRDSALWGKTCAIVGVTTGAYGAIWAQADLRRVLGVAGARVTNAELPVGRAQAAFDEDGRLVDPIVEVRLREHLELLVAEAEVPATVSIAA